MSRPGAAEATARGRHRCGAGGTPATGHRAGQGTTSASVVAGAPLCRPPTQRAVSAIRRRVAGSASRDRRADADDDRRQVIGNRGHPGAPRPLVASCQSGLSPTSGPVPRHHGPWARSGPLLRRPELLEALAHALRAGHAALLLRPGPHLRGVLRTQRRSGHAVETAGYPRFRRPRSRRCVIKAAVSSTRSTARCAPATGCSSHEGTRPVLCRAATA